MMLSKPDLYEIEEVAAEQVPGNLTGAQADLQIKLAEVGMKDPDRVKRRGKGCAASRLVDDSRSIEDIEA